MSADVPPIFSPSLRSTAAEGCPKKSIFTLTLAGRTLLQFAVRIGARRPVKGATRRRSGRHRPLGAQRSRARTSAASRHSVCRSQQRTSAVSFASRSPRSLSILLSFSLDGTSDRTGQIDRPPDPFLGRRVHQCSGERSGPPAGTRFLREVIRRVPWRHRLRRYRIPVSRLTSRYSHKRARALARACGRRGGYEDPRRRVLARVNVLRPTLPARVLGVTTRPRRFCVCVCSQCAGRCDDAVRHVFERRGPGRTRARLESGLFGSARAGCSRLCVRRPLWPARETSGEIGGTGSGVKLPSPRLIGYDRGNSRRTGTRRVSTDLLFLPAHKEFIRSSRSRSTTRVCMRARARARMHESADRAYLADIRGTRGGARRDRRLFRSGNAVSARNGIPSGAANPARDSHGDLSLSSTLPTASRALRYSVRRDRSFDSRPTSPRCDRTGGPPSSVPRFSSYSRKNGVRGNGISAGLPKCRNDFRRLDACRTRLVMTRNISNAFNVR